MKKLTVTVAAVALAALPLAACGNDGSSGQPDGGDAPAAEQQNDNDRAATDKAADRADVVGINEIPVGDSGPQSAGPLTVDLVYFQAVDMEHGSMAMPPASESDMHFEIDVATNEEAEEIGYEPEQYMPYLEIKAVAVDKSTGERKDMGTMMPMIASDGPHYGNNISLEPGEYDVEITIPSPADKFMLHTGKDSSGVKGRFWEEPLKFEFKNWQWDGQLI